jgi:2-phosphosulfolactate phosphatase
MKATTNFFDQSEFDVRCEWGLQAIEYLSSSEIVVIVDVLSFTTSVDIATSRGAKIFPYQWKDDTVLTYAKERGAEVASTRSRFEGEFSLAPSSLVEAPPSLRLVLPSPNGSTIAFRAMSEGATVVAGCLRNAKVVGSWLQSINKSVTVVPAGERWPDGSLRYAVEDLIGAGAILSGLNGRLSPEANFAVAAFERAQPNLLSTILENGSGRELMGRGFICDVELAAEYNVSESVPLLDKDHFKK